MQLRLWSPAVVLCAALVGAPVFAGVIFAGPLTTTVPTALFDPLTTLSSTLTAGEFLIAIETTGALNLQDWSLDLLYNASIARPVDGGGFYQSVYQAYFDGTADLSEITSSGFDLPDLLQGIAGFSQGVSGNGTLAYVLFGYVSGQEGRDPGISVAGGPTFGVPEPSSLALAATSLAALLMARARRRREIHQV
jgi:hypothetical protein